MLIQELRPKSFKEMKGNTLIIKALTLIARDPINKPVSIILQGERGTGKTTSSRIFVKALNCLNKDGDACNTCENCNSINKGSFIYNEYDCSTIGNVDDLEKIKQDFYYTYDNSIYRVVVFDEFHLASKQAQSSLLKVLEDPPKNIFFIFVTTDPDKILDTIKSRSLVLEYPGLTDEDILLLLKQSCLIKNITIDDESLNIIVRRAKGHARDSLSLLEKYKLYGKDLFIETTQTLDKLLKQFLAYSLKNEISNVENIINNIVKNPVMYIEQDFDMFIIDLVKSTFINKSIPTTIYNKIKELIFDYMKYKVNIRTTVDWYSFLFYISDRLGK